MIRVNLLWPAGHICPTYKESFQVRWDNSIPFFSPCCHLPWSISIPLNQSECIFPRNSCVQMILCAMLHAALHTVSFVHGKMHSDWFNGIEILQGRWQHGKKVGYCYPSGLEKTLFEWDVYVPLVTKGLTTFNYCIIIPLLVMIFSLMETVHIRCEEQGST